MKTGVSTACFYPLETEKALIKIGQMGVKTAEIFFNSPSELESDFIKGLSEISVKYSVKIKSIHPYLTFGETYLFFSEYKRRYNDTLISFRKHLSAAQKLGAKFLIIHGSLLPGVISKKEYFERFRQLIEIGKEYGIAVLQENVVKFFSQSPDFLLEMRENLGNDFKMVLDLKQAIRANHSAFEFAEKLRGSIVHVHVSDCKENSDCLPPGEGDFNFKKLITQLNSEDNDIDFIVELYRRNYENENQIYNSFVYLNNLITKTMY